MPVLQQIAYFQGRRDEAPNQELARQLAETGDQGGIAELAENLWNQNPNVQSDCLKTLYETAYLRPALVAPYLPDFLKLLSSRNNRLVWGAMIAIATVAHLKPDEIFQQLDLVLKMLTTGSVITVDNAVKTLAVVAAHQETYRQAIFPILLEHLRTCRPKDLPQHAEKSLVAVNAAHAPEFISVLEARFDNATEPEKARLRKVIRQAGALR